VAASDLGASAVIALSIAPGTPMRIVQACCTLRQDNWRRRRAPSRRPWRCIEGWNAHAFAGYNAAFPAAPMKRLPAIERAMSL
jgi:hypothetical protein